MRRDYETHGNLRARDKMSIEIKKEVQLEIAHILFIDIVAYSKLSRNDQHAAAEELNQLARASEQSRRAEAMSRLTKIPTGNGMALVSHTSPEPPALGGSGREVAGAGGNCRRYRSVCPLSRAIGAGSAGKKRRRAAVREPQPRSRERLFRRWHPGRSPDAPG